MNVVGARTLGYLRGEKDLFEERQRVAEVKEKVKGLSYWLTYANKRRVERFWQVVSLLQENSRMSLVEMSKRLKVPVSTVFDTLKEVEKNFHFTIVLKESERNALLRDTIPIEFPQEVLIATKEEKTTTNSLETRKIRGKYLPCEDSSVSLAEGIQNSQTSSKKTGRSLPTLKTI